MTYLRFQFAVQNYYKNLVVIINLAISIEQFKCKANAHVNASKGKLTMLHSADRREGYA